MIKRPFTNRGASMGVANNLSKSKVGLDAVQINDQPTQPPIADLQSLPSIQNQPSIQ